MAYATASMSNVQKRTIQILNANQSAFATTVSGNVGSFPYSDEVDLAILEADEAVCTSGYFQSMNDSLSTPFTVQSVPLLDQDAIPFHKGTLNRVEVSKTVLNLTSASVDTGTDIITSNGHGLTTGQLVSFLVVSGGLPSGLTAATNYYVIVLTANTFQLATSYANAVYAGTAIDLTTTGSGRWLMIAWVLGVEAQSLDDITNAISVGESYVGTGAFDLLYRPQDGQIYTPAQYARVSYPEYIRTSTLQAKQSEEYLVICGAVMMLTKNASPAPFIPYSQEFMRGIQELITDGKYTQQVDTQANQP